MTRAITQYKISKHFGSIKFFYTGKVGNCSYAHSKSELNADRKTSWSSFALTYGRGLPLIKTTGTKRKILDQKFIYKLATKVFSNSRGLKEIMLKEGFSEENKLKVLGKGSSNGIDTKYFDPYSFKEDQKK